MKAKSITINDVARHAGVSPMTVSRVINRESNVKESTKSLVEESIKTLNYVPNISARALAGAKSYNLALLYSSLAPFSFYLGELVVSALEALSQKGQKLSVYKVTHHLSSHKLVEGLKGVEEGIDGVIVPPPLSDVRSIREYLREIDLPAVYLSGMEGGGRSKRLCIDDRSAAQDITNHLIDLGHKRIAHIKGLRSVYASKERYAGFKQALKDAGIVLLSDYAVDGNYTYQSGLKAANALLSLKEPPTAIFAGNDEMAAATIATAMKMGLTVPDDVSIVGFDDSPLASAVYPRLTTVKQPLSELATSAIDSLMSLVTGTSGVTGSESNLSVLPYELVKGNSAIKPR